jgi:hypothetical protein
MRASVTAVEKRVRFGSISVGSFGVRGVWASGVV